MTRYIDFANGFQECSRENLSQALELLGISMMNKSLLRNWFIDLANLQYTEEKKLMSLQEHISYKNG